MEHNRQHHQGMEQVLMMTTGYRQRQANTQIRKVLAQATHMQTLARTVVEMDTVCRIVGDQLEEHTTTLTTTQTKERTTRKEREKANRWMWCRRISFRKKPQLCRIFHRHRALWKLFGAIKGWIMTLKSENQFTIFNKETRWCRVFAS